MENIHIRLREELDRLELSMAETARIIGEESSQGIRDVCSGRKRASAELIAKLSSAGADVLYILTGQRSAAAQLISQRQRALLDNYDHSDDSGKSIIEGTASLAAQSSKVKKAQ